MNGPGDYRLRSTRFAYIYRYTTAHANLMYRLIDETQQLQSLFSRESAEVSCIGGGPGSDYLGILKYLTIKKKTPRLRCNLFDCEPAWNESWSDVDRKVQAGMQLSLPFITIDVTKQATWKPYTKYFTTQAASFHLLQTGMMGPRPHRRVHEGSYLFFRLSLPAEAEIGNYVS